VTRYCLPSGAQVETDGDRVLELGGAFASELNGKRADLSRDGKAIDLGALPLKDLHTLRALYARLKKIDEPTVTVRCHNCHERFQVVPSSQLELGPYADGELDDEELDVSFDFDVTHVIPALDGSDGTSVIRLVPRTVAEAAPLHRALGKESGLRITSAVVSGMGIVELDGERDAKKIARKLRAASDEVWGAVADWFEIAHYPPRLDVIHECPTCKMKDPVPAPALREFSAAGEGSIARSGSFVSPRELKQIVREEADRIYAELGVRNIALSVIEGPAETDDGGVPLLGCYLHAEPEALPPQPPEIRIFHRTFENMFEEEGPYDVRAEVAETLRHELEHHLAYLAGDDPVDDDERAEIGRELTQRVGKSEVGRRAAHAAKSSVTDFWQKTWYVWLIALAATLLTLLSQR
jgi:hypothetical protein